MPDIGEFAVLPIELRKLRIYLIEAMQLRRLTCREYADAVEIALRLLRERTDGQPGRLRAELIGL